MAIAKCKFCKFEKEAKCSKKKGTTVKLNKRRHCDTFVVDEGRAKDFLDRREKNKVDPVSMPSWFWIKDLRKKKMAEAKVEDLDQFATTVATPSDSKHPLTGDLSKFVAVPEEKNSGSNN